MSALETLERRSYIDILEFELSTALTPTLFRLEYASPESLPSPQTGLLKQVDSKSDMWSLGMILHKLLFFKLPYHYAASGDENGESVAELGEGEKMDRLEQEVLNYPGSVVLSLSQHH